MKESGRKYIEKRLYINIFLNNIYQDLLKLHNDLGCFDKRSIDKFIISQCP